MLYALIMAGEVAAVVALAAPWSTGFGSFASANSAGEGSLDDVPFVVLYDQDNNPASNATSAQNFEPANDIYDNYLGDDFVVPGGQTWNVNQVVVRGAYFNGVGPADSFNVWVYPDSAGFPGAAATCTRSAATYVNNMGVFTINVSPDCVLAPGTYWLVVQSNMNFTPNGQWGWLHDSADIAGAFADSLTTLRKRP